MPAIQIKSPALTLKAGRRALARILSLIHI